MREARGGRRATARRLSGWVMAAAGAALFAASNVASRAGVVILPFDHHHIFGQFGGMLILVAGVVRATR